MPLFTIGYGGRTREEFLCLLSRHGVRTIVDIRLRPDRASMGLWTRARTPDKGIEKLLADAGIGYRSLIELGNVFLGLSDWPQRYQRLMEAAGELLTARLDGLPEPICLLCAEKLAADCHRHQVAEYLQRTKGVEIIHIE